ncbi:hypothetical protein AAHC03_05414 [Spirometra sp. Aus1]
MAGRESATRRGEMLAAAGEDCTDVAALRRATEELSQGRWDSHRGMQKTTYQIALLDRNESGVKVALPAANGRAPEGLEAADADSALLHPQPHKAPPPPPTTTTLYACVNAGRRRNGGWDDAVLFENRID